MCATGVDTSVLGWCGCCLLQMLWTFGRFGYQDDMLRDMMHDIALKLQADCNSKALADVVYAMSQMGWADARLHTLVAEYAMDNIQVGLSVVNVTTVPWGVSLHLWCLYIILLVVGDCVMLRACTTCA